MDEQTKLQLFKDLGSIKAKLEGIDETNKAQNAKLDAFDSRLRKQETRAAGIATSVSLVVSVAITYVKQYIGTGH